MWPRIPAARQGGANRAGPYFGVYPTSRQSSRYGPLRPRPPMPAKLAGLVSQEQGGMRPSATQLRRRCPFASRRGLLLCCSNVIPWGGFLMRYRTCMLAAGLLIGAAGVHFGCTASADDGWTTLLDSTHKGDWAEVGKANWEMKD